MHANWQRRFGILLVLVLLLSAAVVPAASASSAAGSGSCTLYHRVVRGDNLTRIAARYGVTVWQLQQWNGIYNIDRIYVGQVLKIYSSRCGQPAPQPRPQPQPCGACNPCVTCSPCASPCGPAPAYGWQAQFFNNRDLSGSPAAQRYDGAVRFNWGWGAPAAGVNADNFSARWTTTSYASGGWYRFSLRADDGVRLIIDGQVVLSVWQVQAVATHSVEKWLSPGPHTFAIEYFEAEGVAEITYSSVKL